MAGSEDFTCSVLANLRVLGSVPHGGKICVRRGQLAVDPAVHGQFLLRFLYGDSREYSLNHIKNVVTSAVGIIKALVADPRTEGAWESMWTLERLFAEMERCSAGMRNLRATYADDVCMVANLDVQQSRLDAHCAELGRFLHRGDADVPQAPDIKETRPAAWFRSEP